MRIFPDGRQSQGQELQRQQAPGQAGPSPQPGPAPRGATGCLLGLLEGFRLLARGRGGPRPRLSLADPYRLRAEGLDAALERQPSWPASSGPSTRAAASRATARPTRPKRQGADEARHLRALSAGSSSRAPGPWASISGAATAKASTLRARLGNGLYRRPRHGPARSFGPSRPPKRDHHDAGTSEDWAELWKISIFYQRRSARPGRSGKLQLCCRRSSRCNEGLAPSSSATAS